MFKENVSLKDLNTFGIEARAKQFADVSTVEQLKDILARHKDIFVLSGGSNILLTQDLSKPVIHLNLKGINLIRDKEGEDFVHVRAMAGENWHEFVLWSIERGYGGLENLSLIPGNVGTSPMQNIGAYGAEIKDVFVELEAVEIETGKTVAFGKKSCQFGYRESIFKNELKGKFVITSVTFELSKRNHRINTSYGAISSELQKRGIENPGLKDVSEVVISIRQSKLPDPKILGNSGSFFKNPVVDLSLFEKLKVSHPHMPYYDVSSQQKKIPAGWLVEESGFKGKRFGDAGVHKNQALVLVNHGEATGKEILQLAQRIQKEVKSRFDISLEMEVNVI